MDTLQPRFRGGRLALAVVLALPLFACATHGAKTAHNPSAKARQVAGYRMAPAAYRAPSGPSATAYVPAHPQARPPVVAGRGSSASLLRLRAGLNVAALSCRGRGMPNITPAYGRILTRHRALLASAYRSEIQRLGVSGLDRQQTQAYNQFANQRSPVNYCRSAEMVAAQAGSLESSQLMAASPSLVSYLDAQRR